jgi:drug/metabolite transporter (DMT)-like permease
MKTTAAEAAVEHDMTAIFGSRMTTPVRYRAMLVLAVLGICCGIAASLTWVYVLYSREAPHLDSTVTAILILMLALTGGFFLLARFAKKRLRTIASVN